MAKCVCEVNSIRCCIECSRRKDGKQNFVYWKWLKFDGKYKSHIHPFIHSFMRLFVRSFLHSAWRLTKAFNLFPIFVSEYIFFWSFTFSHFVYIPGSFCHNTHTLIYSLCVATTISCAQYQWNTIVVAHWTPNVRSFVPNKFEIVEMFIIVVNTQFIRRKFLHFIWMTSNLHQNVSRLQNEIPNFQWIVCYYTMQSGPAVSAKCEWKERVNQLKNVYRMPFSHQI